MSTSTILPVIHPIEGELDADTLGRLHTAVADAVDGVEKMRRDADSTTGAVLDTFRDLHTRHHRELTAEMAGHGHPPDADGSFHVSGGQRLRFGGSEDDMLQQLLDNERHVLEAYNAALESGGPPDTIELLQRQREELGNLVVMHDSRLAS